jgi:prophage regulatory protein
MRILSKRQLKELVLYSPQHVARLEAAGTFPKRIQLGQCRRYWTGFRSGLIAETSHFMAPDEGVLGRSGDAPPLFSGGYGGRYAWGYRIAMQDLLSAFRWQRMAQHAGTERREFFGRLIVVFVLPTPAKALTAIARGLRPSRMLPLHSDY